MDKSNIKQILFIIHYFYVLIGSKFIILILLLSISFIFEICGLAATIQIVDENFSLNDDINVTGTLFSNFLGLTYLSGTIIAFGVFSLFCLKAIFLYLALVYSGRLRSELLHAVRTKIYNYLLIIRSTNAQSICKGNVMNVISEQSGKLVSCFHSLVFLFIKLITVLIYLLIIFFSNYLVALLGILTTCVVFFVFRSTTNRISKASVELSVRSSELMNITGLAYDNSLELKLGHRKGNYSEIFTAGSKTIQQRFFEISRLNAITQSLTEPIGLLLVGFIFICATVVFQAGVAETIIVCGLLYRSSTQAVGAQKNLQGCLENFGSVTIIGALENDLEKIAEQQYCKIVQDQPLHKLSLDDVSLSMSGRSILNNISVTMQRGEFIAFIGGSGSGKSSILRVLCGLYFPTTGEYILDESILSHSEVKGLRSNFALLTSHSTLNAGSLISQLTDYNYSSWRSVPDEAKKFITSILSLLRVFDFVSEQDLELDKITEVNSQNYSNGQIQRLNLARALISRPKVLFLDEATNGLDTALENEIMRALKALEDLSVVVVTHNKDILPYFDKVYEVNKGIASLSN